MTRKLLVAFLAVCSLGGATIVSGQTAVETARRELDALQYELGLTSTALTELREKLRPEARELELATREQERLSKAWSVAPMAQKDAALAKSKEASKDRVALEAKVTSRENEIKTKADKMADLETRIAARQKQIDALSVNSKGTGTVQSAGAGDKVVTGSGKTTGNLPPERSKQKSNSSK